MTWIFAVERDADGWPTRLRIGHQGDEADMAGKGARYFRVRRKADSNQKAIVDALRATGAHVFDLSGVGGGVPDIAVCRGGNAVLFMEIKTNKGKLRESQSEAAKHWPVVVVRTIDEALAAVGIGNEERKAVR